MKIDNLLSYLKIKQYLLSFHGVKDVSFLQLYILIFVLVSFIQSAHLGTELCYVVIIIKALLKNTHQNSDCVQGYYFQQAILAQMAKKMILAKWSGANHLMRVLLQNQLMFNATEQSSIFHFCSYSSSLPISPLPPSIMCT